ncbi:MAG: metallophosphoesterase [Blautia sp.]|nr:metallophosphoesterase [Blautia sp.]
MIYITGDCHQDFRRFSTRVFLQQKEMAKNDYVIVCGDFGGVWNRKEENKEEKHLMDWLEEKSFTTLFVDGNHENFDRLDAYPVEHWHGGKVHKIRPSVIHLMRGQVFEIDGRSIFAFGGARSHDIKGGILEPGDKNLLARARRLEKEGLPYRVNHISWWEREMPTEEEMEEGRRNLAAYRNTVDIIVTHCCAASTLSLLGRGSGDQDNLTAYLEEIRQKTDFRKWFFGHYHEDRPVNDREVLLYEKIIPVYL